MGLAAGISPGPLLALVISETIKGNRWNGIAIAVSPVITDLPIILISIFLLSSFSGTGSVLALLSISGGCFLIYIGIQNVRFKQTPEKGNPTNSHSLRYGIITNLLSPHPYLFWITIGAPLFVKLDTRDFMAFIIGFYTLLIGSKIGIAIISDKVGGLFQLKVYGIFMKIMGFILLLLAVILIFDGLSILYAER